MAPPRSLFRLWHWSRRIAALLTLVLQVGVGISPLFDHDGRIPRSHVEQRGNRHPRQHNEGTCVVCAVRALQARAVSTDPAPPTRVRRVRQVTIVLAALPASRDAPASNTSRAPPLLS